MAQCCSPGCHRNDETGTDTTMFFEFLPHDSTWVTVCDKHARHDERDTVELTDGVKAVPVETLTHLKDELTG